MTDEQAKEIMMMIQVAYPRFLPTDKELIKAKVDLWKSYMLEWDYEKAKANLRNHIATNKYEPTIADIRPTPKYVPDRKWKEELDAL